MFNLSKRHTVVVAIILAVAMLATRGHHAASLTHLPDASWAIFFMLGFYLRNRVLLPAFLALAGLIDYVSITQFGTSDYCVTAAYVFLVPAYAAMWMSGKWYAERYQFHVRSLPLFAAAAFVGTAACELISSGSFYFFGGRYVEPTLGEFGSRLVQFFPGSLAAAAMYLGIAALVHAMVMTMRPVSTANQ